jgi:hypothetical protein
MTLARADKVRQSSLNCLFEFGLAFMKSTDSQRSNAVFRLDTYPSPLIRQQPEPRKQRDRVSPCVG